MRNRKNWVAAGVISLILLVLTACSEESEPANTENFEEADKVAYEYIVASIEKNDDKKAELLTDEALEEAKDNDLLIEGRHQNEGASEELKDRYEITRYDNLYKGEELYYKVEYAIPNNENRSSDTEYIKMVRTEENDWRLTASTGILNDEKSRVFGNEEDLENGTLIHEYKE